MDETTFWDILDEILGFGEFVVAVPNAAASANIVGKINLGRDGNERVIEKDACHCHVHLEPEKIAQFFFTYIDVGFGKEPCCELKTPQDEVVLRLYLRASEQIGTERFADFSFGNSRVIGGEW